ncbi:MAG: GTPase Era [Clostridia bacterium]|nr:GTPase Era [Clostridia bacterium]
MTPTSPGDVDSGRPDGYRSGFAALIGRPNVGKSTLLNALVGHKVAIVSDKPQTTRNRILGVRHFPGGQVVFVDTPGLHKPRHLLGERMVRSALGALDGIDIVCLVVDLSEPAPGEGDRAAAEAVSRAAAPVLLVGNKRDRVPRQELEPRLLAYRALGDFAAALAVSAVTGEGLDGLVDALRAHLPEGPEYFPDDQVTDQPEQRVAAELIREQVLHLTRDEVPHSVAVAIDEFARRPNGVLYVAATIYVERESQKGIIIGRGGRMLKAIGQGARQEIEALLGTRAFLELHVKVKPDWRNRAGSLEELGFHE